MSSMYLWAEQGICLVTLRSGLFLFYFFLFALSFFCINRLLLHARVVLHSIPPLSTENLTELSTCSTHLGSFCGYHTMITHQQPSISALQVSKEPGQSWEELRATKFQPCCIGGAYGRNKYHIPCRDNRTPISYATRKENLPGCQALRRQYNCAGSPSGLCRCTLGDWNWKAGSIAVRYPTKTWSNGNSSLHWHSS